MKSIITSQGTTGSRSLAKALTNLNSKNAVVHGHFSLSSLYSDFSWNCKTDRSIIFGTEMKNFYDTLSIDQCFQYLKDVFGSDMQNYIFVHTFTINGLQHRKFDFNNKDIIINNLVRRPEDVLKSSLNLLQNGYMNSVFMRNEISLNYTNLIEKLNQNSLGFLDKTSKSLGVEKAMIILTSVYGIKLMLDETIFCKQNGITSYFIEDLTDKEHIASQFLTQFNFLDKKHKTNQIENFQKELSIKLNAHSDNLNSAEDPIIELSNELLRNILDSDIDDYVGATKNNRKNQNITSLKNIAIDIYRDAYKIDADLKGKLLDKLHEIITVQKHIGEKVEPYSNSTEILFEDVLFPDKKIGNIILHDNFIWFCPQELGPVDFSMDSEMLYNQRKHNGLNRCSLVDFVNHFISEKESFRDLLKSSMMNNFTKLYNIEK